MKLKDKITIITGASSGIGKAMVSLFAKEGATVCAIDLNEERLESIVAEIKSQGGEIAGYPGNIADKEQMIEVTGKIVEKYGRIDILMNNAGIMDNMEPLDEISDEVWNRVMNVNLNGPMIVTRLVLKKMLEDGKGAIVNTASIAGLHGGRAGVAYTTSKHGLIGMTKNIAFMYAARGIRCNAICPGAVNTNIGESMSEISKFGIARTNTGMGLNPRVGEPEEIAGLALFLASDDASFINGAAVTIDSGWTAY